MNRVGIFFLIFKSIILWNGQFIWAESSNSRWIDYQKDKEQQKIYEEIRRKGFQEWKKSNDLWEQERKLAAKNYHPPKDTLSDEGEKEFIRDKQKQEQQYIRDQLQFSKEARQRIWVENQENKKIEEAEVSSWISQRPRYQISSRVQVGVKVLKRGGAGRGANNFGEDGSSSMGGYNGNYNSDSQSSGYIPPPPPNPRDSYGEEFPNFNDNNSSIPYDQQSEQGFPAPYFPDDDVPPPPPMEFDDGF